MVALVSGQGLGLLNSSATVLGAQGQFGAAGLGKTNEAVYINLATGNLALQNQDDFVAARDVNLALTRTYNAQGFVNDGNGAQWRLGVLKQLSNISANSITRVNGDGSSSTFTFDATRNAYLSTDGGGAYQVIVRDSATNQWIWRADHFDANGLYETYGDDGMISSTGDVNGSALSYSFQNGRLQSITNANQDITRFRYNNQGLIDEIATTRLASSNPVVRVRYEYDAQQRLTLVATDLAPKDGQDNRSYHTNYRYDGGSNRIRQIWQDDGSRLDFEYDAQGRVTLFTDALGNTSAFDYSVANQTTVRQPLGKQSIYRYDSKQQLLEVEVVQDIQSGQANQVSKFAYDELGNLKQSIDPRGLVTNYDYDANGNRIFEQDMLGNTISRQYDASTNQLLSETRYLQADPDGSGPQTASGALTTRMVYDSAHRLRFQISAEGRVTEYRYNALHQRNASVQYAENTISLTGLSTAELDNAALLTRLTNWSTASSIPKSAISLREYVYDARGLLQSDIDYSVVDANGNGVASSKSRNLYTYDVDGRLLQKIDGKENQTSYVYDGLGRLLSSTDANNVTVSTKYTDRYDDPDVANATLDSSQQTTGRSEAAQTIRFDAMGRIRSQTSGSGNTLNSTSYTYDAAGRLRMTENAIGQKQYFLYDISGRKIAEVDSDGSLVETFYNANNQISRVTRYATRINPNALAEADEKTAESFLASLRTSIVHADDRSTWNIYDQAGRLSETVDATGAVTRMSYDGLSRLTQVKRYAKLINTSQLGNAPSSVNPVDSITTDPLQDRITRSYYDADNLLIATVDAEGSVNKLIYTSSGQLSHSIAYKKQLTLAERSKPISTWGLDDNAVGNLHSYRLYNNQQQHIASIDAENYLTSMRYDAAGNLQSQTRHAVRVTLKAGASWSNLHWSDLVISANSEDQTTSYTYTKLNQLRDETAPDASVTRYSYDQYGLLTNVQRGLGSEEERGARSRYDSLGRKIGELAAEGAQLLTQRELKVAAKQAQPYTKAEIDAIWSTYGLRTSYNNGNQRTSVQDQLGQTTFYYYDADGRLTHSINAAGEVQENRYDAFGALTQVTQFAARLSNTLMAKLQAEQGASSKLLTDGKLTSELINAIDALRSDADNSVQSLIYDKLGRVKDQIDALNYHSYTQYNSFGEISQSGRQIGSNINNVLWNTYSYDGRGNLSKTIELGNSALTSSIEYDAFGRAEVQVDGNKNRQITTYDGLGRVRTVKNPLTPATETTFDAFGRVLTQIDAYKNETRYEYKRATRSFTITTPDKIVHTTTKNRFGETVKIEDSNGNFSSYEYDRAGRLLKVTDNLGLQSSQVYDSNDSGRLMQSIDANGIVTKYEYDAVNRVLKRHFNALDTGNQNGGVQTTSLSYDGKGQVLTSTDARNIVTQTKYYKNGQVKAIIVDPSTAGYQGLNLTTQFEYDSRGNKIKLTDPNGNVTSYDEGTNGLTSTVIVDPNGLKQQSKIWRDATGKNVIMRATGTEPNQQFTHYAYDENNRLVYEMDAEGSVTGYGYDGNTRLSSVTHYAKRSKLLDASNTLKPPYSKERIAASLTPDTARDTVERTLYSADGRVMASIAADGAVSQVLQYDASGRVLEQIRYAKALPPSVVKTAIKDGMTAQAFNDLLRAQGIADPAKDAHQRMVYDARGNLTATASLLQQTAIVGPVQPGSPSFINQWAIVSQRFDANGNLSMKRAYQALLTGATDGSAPSALDVTSFITANDSKSVQATKSDAITTYAYDAANRLLGSASAQKIDSDTLQDRLWAITRHSYDKNGNLIATRSYPILKKSPIADANAIKWMNADSYYTSRQTRYTYDAANRLVFTGVAQNKSPDGLLQWAIVKQDYDAQGNVIARRQFANSVTMHSDATNWDTAFQAVALDPSRDRHTLYAYDSANRATLSLDPLGAATRTIYNAQGDAVQSIAYATPVTNPPAVLKDNFSIASSAQDRISRSVYDQNHRAVLQIDALGYVSQQSYNALGQVETSVRYATALSSADQALLSKESRPAQVQAMLSSSPDDRISRQLFDAAGRVRISVDAMGYLTQYEYDALGHLVQSRLYPQALSVVTANAQFQPLIDLNIQINLAIASQESNEQWRAQIRSQRFSYDAQGRQISSTDALGQTESTEYDALGNKIRFTNKLNAVWTYDYDMAGHLIQTNSPMVDVYRSAPPNAGQASDWGQDTAATRMSMKTVLTYNPLGELISQTDAAGIAGQEKNTSYEYDLVGRQTAIIKITQTLSNNAYLFHTTDPLSAAALVARDSTSTGVRTVVEYNVFGDAISNTDIDFNNGRNILNKHSKIYDKRGQVAYEIDTQVTTGTNRFGNYITGYERDAFGNVSKMTRYGEVVSYAYQQTTQAGLSALLAARSTADKALDRVIETRYDLLGRSSKVIEAATLMYDQTSTTGSYFIQAARTSTSQYNAFGQVIAQSTYAADQSGKRITAAVTQRSYYNQLGQKSAQLAETFDNRAYLSSFAYDAAGNLIRQTEYANAITQWNANQVPSAPPAAEEDRTQLFGYDNNNRKVTQTRVNISYFDAETGEARRSDLSSQFGYDAIGNQISSTDELGSTTYTDYDAQGRTIAIAKVQTGQSPGQRLAPAKSPLTVLRLDAHGNTLLRIDYANGAVSAQDHSALQADATQDRYTAMRYDNQGNLLSSINSELQQQHFAYDLLGRLTDQWSIVSDVNTATGSDGSLSGIKRGLYLKNSYDALGRLIEVTTPANRETEETFPQRKVMQTRYNAFGEVTGHGLITTGDTELDYTRYDNTGHSWLSYAGDGVDRITLYNAQGQESAQVRSTNKVNPNILRQASNLGAALAQADLVMTETRYDALGHVVDSGLATDRTAYALDANGTAQVVSPGVLASEHRIILATPSGVNNVPNNTATPNLSARLRLVDATGQSTWQDAGTRLQLINGYTVLSTAGLTSGSYEYSVTNTPSNAPAYEIGSGMLAIVVQANQQQSISATNRIGSDHISRDRWGNAIRMIDLRDATWATDYLYNDRNQLIEQTNVAVDVWNPSSLQNVSERTKTKTRYDAAGRVLATVDAKGNINQMRYNVNGYLSQEIHADGGLVNYTVDIFGQRVQTAQQMEGSKYQIQNYGFNRLGQLTKHWTQPVDVYSVAYDTMKATEHNNATIVDEYVYDEQGRRVSTANYSTHDYKKVVSQRLLYDLNGNLIRNIDALGNQTRMAYDKFNHKIEQVDANNVPQLLINIDPNRRSEFKPYFKLTWQYDANGRVTQHRDLNGRQTDYKYDAMGRLIAETGSNGSTLLRTMDYDNKGNLLRIKEKQGNDRDKVSEYTYDEAGNRLTEKVTAQDSSWVSQDVILQDQTLTYNAMGWLVDVKSNVRNANHTIHIDFDRNGNRVRMQDAYLASGMRQKEINMNYGFDAMNRQVHVDGLVHNTMPTPQDGNVPQSQTWFEKIREDMRYDLMGNRASAEVLRVDPKRISTNVDYKETYQYDAAGRLSIVMRDNSEYAKNGYDSAGRTMFAKENTYVRTYVFDQAGRVIKQDSRKENNKEQSGSDKYVYDNIGNVISYDMVLSASHRRSYEVIYNAADRYDTYNESETRVTSTETNETPNTTRKLYDTTGQLIALTDQESPENNRLIDYDSSGHVLRTYYTTGNLARSTNYSLLINGQLLGSSNTFHESLSKGFDTANSATFTNAPGSYMVVSPNETVKSIANAVWGDSSLWYMIADANGLGYDSPLAVGSLITIPTRINTQHNDYQTYQPYNAASLIGDTTPQVITPKQNDCGAMGQIIMIIVSVAVASFLGPHMLPFVGSLGLTGTAATIAAGALAGAGASIASQGVGIAMGIQDGFNWKGVALAAIGGGVSAGFNGVPGAENLSKTFDLSGTIFNNAAGKAILSNLTTQAIGKITHAQEAPFSWRSVAAAGIAAQVGEFVGDKLLENSIFSGASGFDKFANRLVKNFASSTAAAVVHGGKISPVQIAVDAFGNALGSSLGEALKPKADPVSEFFGGSSFRLPTIEKDNTVTNDAPVPLPSKEIIGTDTTFINRLLNPNVWDGKQTLVAANGGFTEGFGDKILNVGKITAEGMLNGILKLAPSDEAIQRSRLRYEAENKVASDKFYGVIDTGISCEILGDIGSWNNPAQATSRNRQFGVGIDKTWTNDVADGMLTLVALELTGVVLSPFVNASAKYYWMARGEDALLRNSLKAEFKYGANSLAPLPKSMYEINSGLVFEPGSIFASQARGIFANSKGLKVDLFGGANTQVPGAINIDLFAKTGIKADIAQGLGFLPSGSAKSITAFNPFTPRKGQFMNDVLDEARRVLQPGGEFIISATRNNPYVAIKKFPTEVELNKMGFEVMHYRVPLTKVENYADRFKKMEFSQSGGKGYINPEDMQTVVLRKKK